MAALTVWFRFLSGGFAGETRTVQIADGEAISIGRADDNQVVLHEQRDFAASSYHAQVMNSGGTLYLYDSGSTNGTWMGGQRVQQAPLPSGSRVTFGRGGPEVEIVAQPAGAAPPPGAPISPGGYETRPVPGADPLRAPPAAPPPSIYDTHPAASPSSSPAAALPFAAAVGGVEKKTEPREFRAMPSLPSPAHMPDAYAAPVSPAIATDTCGMCGHLLFFVCYQCRRTLCASHYEPSTGVCTECAGSPAGAAPVPMPGGGAFAPAPAAEPPAYGGGYGAPAAPADDDDPGMRIPTRRRRPQVAENQPVRRRGAALPADDDELPPHRRSGPPPGDDELPPRRRRPQ